MARAEPDLVTKDAADAAANVTAHADADADADAAAEIEIDADADTGARVAQAIQSPDFPGRLDLRS
ncbi:MAG: hypothetical protein IPM79_01975 [Polyangiaceae bacterium]|jgi:hypothetical protein|nr:hypothetical protein [Polyangiaceae bacterium]MBK8936435.1 hypothetical protein [Polyangiaceae bacterium]